MHFTREVLFILGIFATCAATSFGLALHYLSRAEVRPSHRIILSRYSRFSLLSSLASLGIVLALLIRILTSSTQLSPVYPLVLLTMLGIFMLLAAWLTAKCYKELLEALATTFPANWSLPDVMARGYRQNKKLIMLSLLFFMLQLGFVLAMGIWGVIKGSPWFWVIVAAGLLEGVWFLGQLLRVSQHNLPT